MRHAFLTFLLSMAILLVANVSPSFADANCSEGKTASGACVKPGLAKLMRWQAILMTQSKLSYTAPLTMPGDKQVILPQRPIFEANVVSQPVGRRR
jgi:hypothetical protein